MSDMTTALADFLRDNNKSQKWLADSLGVKPPSVHAWLKDGVPPKRVPAVSQITGIPMSDLRPDMFSNEAA